MLLCSGRNRGKITGVVRNTCNPFDLLVIEIFDFVRTRNEPLEYCRLDTLAMVNILERLKKW